ncbi:MAG TPA: hypothetical protein VMW58_13200 [Anaerolineae bacterium]|nr:hypothetical protein [Anaerolineae bacterium]
MGLQELTNSVIDAMGVQSIPTAPPLTGVKVVRFAALTKKWEELEGRLRRATFLPALGASTQLQSQCRAVSEAASLIRTWLSSRMGIDITEMKGQLNDALARASTLEDTERRAASAWSDPQDSYIGEREPDLRAAIAFHREWVTLHAEIFPILELQA